MKLFSGMGGWKGKDRNKKGFKRFVFVTLLVFKKDDENNIVEKVVVGLFSMRLSSFILN